MGASRFYYVPLFRSGFGARYYHCTQPNPNPNPDSNPNPNPNPYPNPNPNLPLTLTLTLTPTLTLTQTPIEIAVHSYSGILPSTSDIIIWLIIFKQDFLFWDIH